jgi:hypothetical protein
MQLTDKQRKYAWIGAAVLGLIYFGPTLLNGVRHLASSGNASTAQAKPSAARVALPSPVNTTPIAPPVVDPLATRLLGTWQALGDLPARGFCTLSLQVKRDPVQPGTYQGYSTISCLPSLAIVGARPTAANRALDAANDRTPTSTIMSGPLQDGSIQFHIDRLIGIPVNGCKITGFSLTPFSDGAVAAQWQNAPCPEGNLILHHPGNRPF